MDMREPPNRFQRPSVNVTTEVEDQSRISRHLRLKEGRCPLHDKPMLQSDVWYRPTNGQRYTYVSCMHHSCAVEAVCNGTYDTFVLIPKYRFLLEQTDEGIGSVLKLPFNI